MITLYLSKKVSLNQGATSEEGMPILNEIVTYLEQGNQVTLDFKDINLVTTAFLNVIIGRLYEKFNSEQLKQLLKFDHLTDGIAARIKAVTDSAKDYYRNKDTFNKDVDSILYGNN